MAAGGQGGLGLASFKSFRIARAIFSHLLGEALATIVFAMSSILSRFSSNSDPSRLSAAASCSRRKLLCTRPLLSFWCHSCRAMRCRQQQQHGRRIEQQRHHQDEVAHGGFLQARRSARSP